MPFERSYPHSRHFWRGRDALAYILSELKAVTAEPVLLPDLCCADVHSAVEQHGQRVLLYSVDPRTLIPDLATIRRGRGQGARIILIINYFGHLQDLTRIDEIKSLGLTVVEDGTHSLLGGGCYGNFFCASLRKMLPVAAGAVASFTEQPTVSHRAEKTNAMVRYFFWEHCAKLTRYSAGRDAGKLARVFLEEFCGNAEMCLRTDPADSSFGLHLGKSAFRRIDWVEIAKRRCDNWNTLSAAFADVSVVEPLKKRLGSSEVPFGFAVQANHSGLLCDGLRFQGVTAGELWGNNGIVSAPMVLPVGPDYDPDDMMRIAGYITESCS